MPESPSRRELRSKLRARRRGLANTERKALNQRIVNTLARDPLFRRARHIAFYLPNDGEVDLTPLLRRAWRQGKHCYLPVLRPYRQPRLWFRPYRRGQRLCPNRFRIDEPCRRLATRPPWSLDLVLAPLVGFDAEGNRLGMGGGFYDRSFAYLRQRALRQHPPLLGVAHEFQRLPPGSLEAMPWDVPLWGVVTEAGVFRF